MPCRARIAPYALPTPVHLDQGLTLVQGGIGVLGDGVGHDASLPRVGELLDVQVHRDGEQEHDAEEGTEPVRVPAGVDDALAWVMPKMKAPIAAPIAEPYPPVSSVPPTTRR